MDIFTQKRFTISLIVVLVILNIGTLALLWLREIHRPGPPLPPQRPPADKPGSASMLKSELGLSDEQFERYRELREQHREKTAGIQDEMHALKRRLFNELFESELDTLEVERIIRVLADKEEMLERVTFAHLRDLRDLCGEGQKEKLQKLLDEFFRATGQPPQRPDDRPPPRSEPGKRF